MGLAGRKDKQRIGADPRNLTWADNAAKFGAQYLSKFGWDASSGSGLGVRGDGMTSHIKVAHKLDLLGIGAGGAAKDGKDGVAWKQAREFEILLMRLNQSNAGEGDEGKEVEKEEKGVGEDEDTEEMNNRKRKNKDVDGGEENDVGEGKNEKMKRRKLASDSESTLVGTGGASVESKAAETREERKARKVEKTRRKEEKVAKAKDKKDKKEKRGKSKEKKERGKAREPSPSSESSSSTSPSPESTSNSNSGASTPAVIRAPRPMAHRARFLASKRLALTNASAVSEILGVASSSSSANPSAYPSACATPVPPSGTVSPTGFGEGSSRYGLGSGKLTPATDDADIERDPKMERLTMATKSVAEYFAERMAKKAAGTAKGPGTCAVVASSSMKNGDEDMDDGERPRVGLGHTSRTALAFGQGGEADESVTRPGLGMRSGSGLGFKGFAAAASSPLPDIENVGDKEDAKKEVEGERKKKSEKRDKGGKGETKKKRKEKPS